MNFTKYKNGTLIYLRTHALELRLIANLRNLEMKIVIACVSEAVPRIYIHLKNKLICKHIFRMHVGVFLSTIFVQYL